MAEVSLSRHSVHRARERIGVPKRAVLENAQRAYECGLGRHEAKGGLRNYIESLYDKDGANNIRVYNRFVYLFHGRTLITIFSLPRKYNVTADQQQRRKKQISLGGLLLAENGL